MPSSCNSCRASTRSPWNVCAAAGRVFLRLFPAACHSVQDFNTDHAERFPWPTSQQKLQAEEKQDFLSLIARDQYCHDCLAARQSPDWQDRLRALTRSYLHCSGCQADHPACLFSAKQRRAPPSTRVCIGHEGWLRACEHQTANWEVVLGWASDEGVSSSKCTMKEHVEGCKGPRPSEPDKLKGCYPWRPNLWGYRPTGLKRVFFVMEVAWSAHVQLPRGQDGRFTREELSRKLEKLQEGAARFASLQLEPGPPAGSRLFDPTRCDCLEYHGREQTAWHRPLLEWRKYTTCRADPTTGFGQARIPEDELNSLSHRLGSIPQCYVEINGSGACPDDMSCTYSPISRVEIRQCSGCQRCARISFFTWVHLDLDEDGTLRRMNSQWYQVLEPESYKLTDDKDGFAVYWCMAKACRNYYKYGRSRLVSLLRPSDYTHTCPK